MAYYRFECNQGDIPSNLTVVAAILNNKQKTCKHCKHCTRRAMERCGGVPEMDLLKPDNPLVAWQQHICERQTIAKKIMNRTGKNDCQLLFNRSTTVDARDKATVQRMIDHADRMNPDHSMKRVIFYDRLPNGCCVAGPESIVPKPKEHKADRAYEITGLPAISKQEMLGENSCRRRSMFINSKLFQQGMRKKKREIRSVVEFFPDIEFLQVVGKAIPFAKPEDIKKMNADTSASKVNQIPKQDPAAPNKPSTDIQEKMLSTTTDQEDKMLTNFPVTLNEPKATDPAGKDASASKVNQIPGKFSGAPNQVECTACLKVNNPAIDIQEKMLSTTTDQEDKMLTNFPVTLNESKATDPAGKDASASKVNQIPGKFSGAPNQVECTACLKVSHPAIDIQEGMLSTATDQDDKMLKNFPVTLNESKATDPAGKDVSASKVNQIPKKFSGAPKKLECKACLKVSNPATDQTPKETFKSEINAHGNEGVLSIPLTGDILETNNTNMVLVSAPIVLETVLSTSFAPTHPAEKSSKFSHRTDTSSVTANIDKRVLSKSLKQSKTRFELNAHKSEVIHDAKELNNLNEKETTSSRGNNVTISKSKKPDFDGHASQINTTDVNEVDSAAKSKKPDSEGNNALLVNEVKTPVESNKSDSEVDNTLLNCACSQINTTDIIEVQTTADGDALQSCACSQENNTDVEGGTAVESINPDTAIAASTFCICSKTNTPHSDEIGTRSPDVGKSETSATDNYISEFLLEKIRHITPSGTKILEDVGEACTKASCDQRPKSATKILEDVGEACTKASCDQRPKSATKIVEDVGEACTKASCDQRPKSATKIVEDVDEECTEASCDQRPKSGTNILEDVGEACTKATCDQRPKSVNQCTACKSVQPDDDDSELFVMEVHSCSCCGIICHCKGSQTSSG